MTGGHIKNTYLAENFYTPGDLSHKGPNLAYLYETEPVCSGTPPPGFGPMRFRCRQESMYFIFGRASDLCVYITNYLHFFTVFLSF